MNAQAHKTENSKSVNFSRPDCLLSAIQASSVTLIFIFNNLRGDFTSFPASGDFYHLLITFANSLDPGQARQNVGPDLDPNCLTLTLSPLVAAFVVC